MTVKMFYPQKNLEKRMRHDKELTEAQCDEREGEHRQQREGRRTGWKFYDLWKWVKQLSEVKGMALENIQMVNLIYPTQTYTQRMLSHIQFFSYCFSNDKTRQVTVILIHHPLISVPGAFALRRSVRLCIFQIFGYANNWQKKSDVLWMSRCLTPILNWTSTSETLFNDDLLALIASWAAPTYNIVL